MEHRSSNCSNRASGKGAYRHPGQKTYNRFKIPLRQKGIHIHNMYMDSGFPETRKTYNTDLGFPCNRSAYTYTICIWIQDFSETRKRYT